MLMLSCAKDAAALPVQALVQHLVGRQWRRKLEGPPPQEVARVLHWFGDQPSQQQPFSLHAMCAAGRPYGCARSRPLACMQPAPGSYVIMGIMQR